MLQLLARLGNLVGPTCCRERRDHAVGGACPSCRSQVLVGLTLPLVEDLIQRTPMPGARGFDCLPPPDSFPLTVWFGDEAARDVRIITAWGGSRGFRVRAINAGPRRLL